MASLYSERQGVWEKEPPRYEHVPLGVREWLIQLILNHLEPAYWEGWGKIYEQVTESLAIPAEIVARFDLGDETDEQIVHWRIESGTMDALHTLIRECAWNEFYDVCEVVYEVFDNGIKAGDIGIKALGLSKGRGASERLLTFQDELNKKFHKENLGHIMKDGKIERILALTARSDVDRALKILGQKRFEGPREQFIKGLRFLDIRPQPDTKNCIKEVVGAVEGIARILTGKPNLTLHDIVNKELEPSGKLRKPLDEIYEKVYGYRGDAPGVSHGQTTSEEVPIEDAEFILGICGLMIEHLNAKYAKADN